MFTFDSSKQRKMKTRKTISFPDSMDVNGRPVTFNSLEELQNFFWNAKSKDAQELEEIYAENGINLLALCNYPHEYNIIQGQPFKKL